MKWALALIGMAAVTTGCAGFWDPITSTSTAVTSTTLSSGYFYLLDAATSQIIAYQIVSGTLTEVGSYATPSAPIALAVAPDDEYLVVSTTSGIYSYAISSGALTLNSATVSTDPAVAVQVDAQSKWLVESSATGYLNAVPLVATSGELDGSRSSGQVALAGTIVNQIVIAPNDDYVFVACGSNGTKGYAFSASSSEPLGSAAYASIAPVTTSSGAAVSVAMDPSTRLLYIGETAATSSGGGLRAFSISASGGLAELSGSPMSSGGTGPYAILPKSTGDYVYVANWNGTSAGNITGFAISETDSVFSLTELSTAVATGIEPVGLVEDNEGNFVLAVSSQGSPYFDAYYFDTTTAGVLDTTITSSSFAATAVAAQH